MKTKHLLLGIFIAVFGFGSKALAQSSVNPDTVCAGTKGALYYVTQTKGSTYKWIVNNGTVTTGAGTDSILVDWSSTTGTDIIDVVETNMQGCIGDTVKLVVYRMPLPTAILSGTDTIGCNGNSQFDINFTGIGPWNITYSDGTNSTTVNNVSANPYTVKLTGIGLNTTYTIKAISNKFGCVGTESGTFVVVVNNKKPSTSVIYHK